MLFGATALSTDLSDGDFFTTLKGYDIDVTITNGDVFINDAQVVLQITKLPMVWYMLLMQCCCRLQMFRLVTMTIMVLS